MTCLRTLKLSDTVLVNMLRVSESLAKISDACFSDVSKRSTNLFFTCWSSSTALSHWVSVGSFLLIRLCRCPFNFSFKEENKKSSYLNGYFSATIASRWHLHDVNFYILLSKTANTVPATSVFFPSLRMSHCSPARYLK